MFLSIGLISPKFIFAFLRIFQKHFFTDLTSLSKNQPVQVTTSWLNVYLIFLFLITNSVSSLTKAPPLSKINCFGAPDILKNLFSTLIHTRMPLSLNKYKYITQLLAHVFKEIHDLYKQLSLPQMFFINTRPAESIPQ